MKDSAQLQGGASGRKVGLTQGSMVSAVFGPFGPGDLAFSPGLAGGSASVSARDVTVDLARERD